MPRQVFPTGTFGSSAPRTVALSGILLARLAICLFSFAFILLADFQLVLLPMRIKSIFR